MKTAAVRYLAIVALAAGAAAHAAEESAAPVSAGQRVRVSAPSLSTGTVVGSVVSIDDHDITIRIPRRAEPLALPRTAIIKLEVSDGRRSRAVGAAAGALIGALAGLAAGSRSTEFTQEIQAGGAAIGALLGAGVGAAIPPAERWRTVASADRRVRFVPRPDLGLGGGFSVGF